MEEHRRRRRSSQPRAIGQLVLAATQPETQRVEQADPLSSIRIHLLDPTPITGVAELPVDQADQEEEQDEYADEPFEEESSTVAVDDEYWDDQEDQDEYSQRINAVQISDVDMGRSDDAENSLDHDAPAAEPESNPPESIEEDGENSS